MSSTNDCRCFKWGGGDRGREPERIGAGEEREAGEKRAGSGSSKMAGCGNEIQNATR